MTIRDKVEEESPDGRVLSIEDLRKCLGIGPPQHHSSAPGEVSASIKASDPVVEVLLVGHDLRGDFPKMRTEGMDFHPYLHYVGCVDTHVVVEDACEDCLPKGLGRLMQYYGLASGRIVNPSYLPASKAKFVFFGGHNAGNGAIGTLKVSIAQALDRGIKSNLGGEARQHNYLTDEILSHPLKNIKRNLVLLSYDSESVESNRYDRKRKPIGPATTEHGWIWPRLPTYLLDPMASIGILIYELGTGSTGSTATSPTSSMLLEIPVGSGNSMERPSIIMMLTVRHHSMICFEPLPVPPEVQM